MVAGRLICQFVLVDRMRDKNLGGLGFAVRSNQSIPNSFMFPLSFIELIGILRTTPDGLLRPTGVLHVHDGYIETIRDNQNCQEKARLW
jgi:hypothetical protein